MGKIAFLAAFDSQIKWSRMMAELLAGQFEVDILIVTTRDNQLSEEQLQEYLGDKQHEFISTPDLINSDRLAPYDAIFLSLNGAAIERFCFEFYRWCEGKIRKNIDFLRPTLISGYVGLVIEGHYGGILYRRLCDYVLANGAIDKKFFEGVLNQYKDAKNTKVMDFGLPLIPHFSTPKGTPTAPKTVLFAAQPTVPGQLSERLYVLLQLTKYAEKFPDRKVVIKPRTRVGEDTFHREPFHYRTIYNEYFSLWEKPENLIFDHRPIQELFQESDFVITISSTAALEAYAAGRHFGVITDFGIRDNYGTATFVDSGAFLTFGDLLDDRIPEVDDSWVQRMLTPSATRLSELSEKIRKIPAASTLPPKSESYFFARSQATSFDMALNSTRYKRQVVSAYLTKSGFLTGELPEDGKKNIRAQAEVLASEGKSGLAIANLYALLMAYPKDAGVAADLCKFLVTEFRFDECIDILQTFDLEAIRSSVLYRVLASAFAGREEFFSASQEIQFAEAIDPDSRKIKSLLNKSISMALNSKQSRRMNTQIVAGFDGWGDQRQGKMPSRQFVHHADMAAASGDHQFAIAIALEDIKRSGRLTAKAGLRLIDWLLAAGRKHQAVDLYLALKGSPDLRKMPPSAEILEAHTELCESLAKAAGREVAADPTAT